jgi:hypothetical protein
MGKVKTERLSSKAVRERDEVVIDNPICPVCGMGSKSRVSTMQYYLLSGGQSISDLCSTKTAQEKNIMITGIHGHCAREKGKS